MLKPKEREAVAGWWRDTGCHLFEGAVTMLISVSIPFGLLFGFTVN